MTSAHSAAPNGAAFSIIAVWLQMRHGITGVSCSQAALGVLSIMVHAARDLGSGPELVALAHGQSVHAVVHDQTACEHAQAGHSVLARHHSRAPGAHSL